MGFVESVKNGQPMIKEAVESALSGKFEKVNLVKKFLNESINYEDLFTAFESLLGNKKHKNFTKTYNDLIELVANKGSLNSICEGLINNTTIQFYNKIDILNSIKKATFNEGVKTKINDFNNIVFKTGLSFEDLKSIQEDSVDEEIINSIVPSLVVDKVKEELDDQPLDESSYSFWLENLSYLLNNFGNRFLEVGFKGRPLAFDFIEKDLGGSFILLFKTNGVDFESKSTKGESLNEVLKAHRVNKMYENLVHPAKEVSTTTKNQVEYNSRINLKEKVEILQRELTYLTEVFKDNEDI